MDRIDIDSLNMGIKPQSEDEREFLSEVLIAFNGGLKHDVLSRMTISSKNVTNILKGWISPTRESFDRVSAFIDLPEVQDFLKND